MLVSYFGNDTKLIKIILLSTSYTILLFVFFNFHVSLSTTCKAGREVITSIPAQGLMELF